MVVQIRRQFVCFGVCFGETSVISLRLLPLKIKQWVTRICKWKKMVSDFGNKVMEIFANEYFKINRTRLRRAFRRMVSSSKETLINTWYLHETGKESSPLSAQASPRWMASRSWCAWASQGPEMGPRRPQVLSRREVLKTPSLSCRRRGASLRGPGTRMMLEPSARLSTAALTSVLSQSILILVLVLVVVLPGTHCPLSPRTGLRHHFRRPYATPDPQLLYEVTLTCFIRKCESITLSSYYGNFTRHLSL